MTLAIDRGGLTYRPTPMLLSARHRRSVSRELCELMHRREKARAHFVELNEACCKAETDDAISIQAFADLDERRNEALGASLRIDDEILLYDPQSIADLAIIVAMARHQMSHTDIPEDFLAHLLTSVERLVLEAGHE